MKITDESKLEAIAELENFNQSQAQSVEEENIQKSTTAEIIRDKMSRTFFIRKPVTELDFVEKSIMDNLFETAGKDLFAIGLASDKLDKKIKTIKEEINTKYEDLQLTVNNLSSIIDWVSLYNSVTFSNIGILQETFNNRNDIISQDDPLIVDTFEGKVTLNTESIDEIDLSKATVTINDNSNGSFAEGNGVVNAVDGSEFSYLEYTQDSSQSRVDLDFTVSLDKAKVINQIVINPNDFSTQNWVEVIDVQTSLNGIDFYSINDADTFYRSMLFEETDKEIRYVLDPESNGYSSKFTIDFQPTKAKHIRFVFRQKRLHPLSDDYKIGINEIKINRATYSGSGSIIIKKDLDLSTLKSLSIKSGSESNVDSSLLNIKYSISFDMKDWKQIQPVSSNGELPEILNFNQSWLPDSVSTERYSENKVYLKVEMNKRIDPSSIEKLLSSYSLQGMKIADFPKSDPYSIQLENEPLKGSLQLFAMPYMAAGKENLDTTVLGKTNKDTSSYMFELPFDPDGLEAIVIDNTVIPKYNDVDDIGSLIDGNAMGYFIFDNKLHIHLPEDPVKREGNHLDPWMTPTAMIATIPDDEGPGGPGDDIWFAEPTVNITPGTQVMAEAVIQKRAYPVDWRMYVPPTRTLGERLRASQEITMKLNPEVKNLSKRRFSLKHYSDGVKNNIKITRMRLDENNKVVIQTVTDIVGAGKTRVKLSAQPLINDQISLLGGSRVEYIDGFREFISASEFAYSVDSANQMLHLRDAYGVDVHISYQRELKEVLSSDDFELAQNAKDITIREWAFDPASTYVAEYNVAVKVPENYYSVAPDKKSVHIAGEQIINSIYAKSEFEEKKIKVVYNYKENLNDVVSEIADALTPILNKVSIIYSTDTL